MFGIGMTKAERYLEFYRIAHSVREKYYTEKKNNEEFYYNDVDGTFSEFNLNQKATIDDSFGIPISTKLCYPIIEQLLSFITGAKPFPRLLSSSPNTAEYTEAYQQAYHGVWYESHSDDELKNAIKDMLVTGSGYLRVRKNNFFNETTFNVIHEYLPWKHVLVDPLSEKSDLSDARFIIVAKKILQAKAEEEYGVKIDYSNSDTLQYPVEDDDSEYPSFGYGSDENFDKEHRFVRLIEMFLKKEIYVYVSDKGEVGTKRPTPIDMPNPRKLALNRQLEQLYQQEGMVAQQGEQLAQQKDSYDKETAYGLLAQPEEYAQEEAGEMQVTEQMDSQMTAVNNQIQMLELAMAQEPDTVPGYRMVTERGNVIETLAVTKLKKKRIERVLIVGDKIVESEILISDKYPIIHLCIQHRRNPYKTYGMIHYIKDMVKAMNKMWYSMLYDMAVSNSPKVLYAEGTIEKIADTETAYATPHAWIKYVPDPSLPNGGMPTVIPPSPVSQATVYVLQSLQQLIEYISGMFGVVQGNGDSAPSTFSATQSLQNFGTQRAKLYSRSLERALEDLAYTTVVYLQRYAPRDKVLMYLDDNGDAQEVMLMDNKEDLQFKVRVEITSSLPTFQQASAQLLGNIAQTAGDPNLQALLTKFYLDVVDIPQGKEWSQKLDIIAQMQSQLEELQTALKEKDGMMKSMENNLAQKEIANKVSTAVQKAQSQIDLEQQSVLNNEQETEDVPLML
jgi:hypothetical protein